MDISLTPKAGGEVLVARLSGRLDAASSGGVGERLHELHAAKVGIVDLSGVDYLSSAGVRVFLTLFKSMGQSGRKLILSGLQPYCREVIRISGLDGVFQIEGSLEEALAEAGEPGEVHHAGCGKFRFEAGSSEPGAAEILGHIEDVLASRITESHVASKKFSAKEYSIGLGALGPGVSEVMPYLGEMITIGGTMVWLPTDGKDTPDFLVPHGDSEDVLIRTGFNVSLTGEFHEYAEFEAVSPQGATLSEIYRALFDLARNRRSDYRGAIGLAMRAEMSAVFGSGVTKSPILDHAPANGKLITDPSNFREWFEFDDQPRHRDVTGLICGLGLDLDCDLSVFDRKKLGSTFYLNPANSPSSREMLHNHGVFFSPQPLGEKPLKLEQEIQRVVEHGDFVDMRHLLDKCRVAWGLIGILYLAEFREDPAGSKADR